VLNLDEIYLAEYSVPQRCFHIETACEAIESNLRQMVGSWTNSFLPFAICSSRMEASRACDVLREQMEAHSKSRGTVSTGEEMICELCEVTGGVL